MPTDSNGNYSLPPGYLAVTGQVIQASQHNPSLEDLASNMTGRLPRNGSAPMLANLPMASFKITQLGAGTASTDAATVGQLQSAVPVGVVVDYAGAAPPPGWLFCAGQEVSRADYAALFAALGTVYGAGNGSTTFNLPDLRGRVSAGRDDMGGANAARLSGVYGSASRQLGGTLGSAGHTLTALEMPSHSHGAGSLVTQAHSHTLTVPTREGNWSGSGSDNGRVSSSNPAGAGLELILGTSAIGGLGIGGATAAIGSNHGHPNAQPSLIMHKIIKAG